MVQSRGRVAAPLVAAVAMLTVVACGETIKIPQASGSGGALTAASVQIRQSGSGHARIDPSNVTFQIDNSGSLLMHVSVTSTGGGLQTVTLDATLYDSGGNIVGTAVGGNVNVPPASTSTFNLSGQQPTATIASATIEVSSEPAATAP